MKAFTEQMTIIQLCDIPCKKADNEQLERCQNFIHSLPALEEIFEKYVFSGRINEAILLLPLVNTNLSIDFINKLLTAIIVDNNVTEEDLIGYIKLCDELYKINIDYCSMIKVFSFQYSPYDNVVTSRLITGISKSHLVTDMLLRHKAISPDHTAVLFSDSTSTSLLGYTLSMGHHKSSELLLNAGASLNNLYNQALRMEAVSPEQFSKQVEQKSKTKGKKGKKNRHRATPSLAESKQALAEVHRSSPSDSLTYPQGHYEKLVSKVALLHNSSLKKRSLPHLFNPLNFL